MTIDRANGEDEGVGDVAVAVVEGLGLEDVEMEAGQAAGGLGVGTRAGSQLHYDIGARLRLRHPRREPAAHF